MITEIQKKVDALAEITREMEALKVEAEELKTFFEKDAADRLKDSKEKSVTYWGSENAKVVVQTAETVKPVAMSVLRQVLGDVYGDFVKEEVKYTFVNPNKTLLANMFTGAFVESNLIDEIKKITDDPKTQSLLVKKLKGKYEQDKNNLIKLVGLSEQEASDTAYLIQEVMTYEKLMQIKNAVDWQGTFDEMLAKVKASLIVDETIKVTIDKE